MSLGPNNQLGDRCQTPLRLFTPSSRRSNTVLTENQTSITKTILITRLKKLPCGNPCSFRHDKNTLSPHTRGLMSPDTTSHPLWTYREFLTRTPGPIALYLIDDRPNHPPAVSWLVKTDQTTINALGPTPYLEFRLGALQVKTVFVMVLLIRIAHTDMIFESWINGHTPSQDGWRVIQMLQEQPFLTIHFFNDETEEQRAIRVDNPSPHFFHQCASQILHQSPWTMDAFDQAKETIYAAYPSPVTLWNALQSLPPST